MLLVKIQREEDDRMDMTIDTDKFNTKLGQSIPIDDVDESLIKPYYLSEEKRNLKRVLWEAKHGDWVKTQELKLKERELSKSTK